MLSSISRLREFLNEAPHDYRASTNLFLDFEIEKVKKEMRLVERGRERGNRGEPPTGGNALDEVEQEIVRRIGEQHKEDTKTYHANLESYDSWFHRLGLEAASSKIKDETLAAIGDFKTEISQGRDELYDRRRDVLEGETSFAKFRNGHNLEDRPALYSTPPILQIGIIALLLLIEAGLNSSLLSVGHLGGIIGAIGQAIIFAVINVIFLAVPAAVAWRYAHHRNINVKLLALVSLVIVVTAMVIFNLIVAHYRDALGGELYEQAGIVAWDRFKADYFALELTLKEVPSISLLLVGISFSLCAAVGWAKMEDAYPGYSKLDRMRRKRNESYTYKKGDLLHNLQGIRIEAAEAMHEAQENLRKRHGEYFQALEGRKRLGEKFRAQLHYLAGAANELLQVYREANREARKTKPPKHFAKSWQLEPFHEDLKDGTVRGLDEAKLVRLIEETTEALDKAIAELHAAYEQAIQEYRHIEDMTEKELRYGAAGETA